MNKKLNVLLAAAVLAVLIGVAGMPAMDSGTVILTSTRRVPSQYATIQAAVNAAVNGDTIMVAPGNYYGVGNRDIDFLGKAITLKSEAGPHFTKILCQASDADPHKGVIFERGETSTSVLDGFTITGCRASNGSAINIYQSSPTIKNNIITANSYSGSPYYDGNIRIARQVYSNTPFPQATFINNVVSNNTGNDFYCRFSDLLVKNALLYHSAGEAGFRGPRCKAVFENVTVRGYSIGIYRESDVPPPPPGGPAETFTTTVTNSIIWGNSYDDIYGGVVGSYSTLQAAPPPSMDGGNNVYLDPLFVNPAAGNFKLGASSPAINRGNPASQFNDPDASRNDMGFYGGPRSDRGRFVRVSPTYHDFGQVTVGNAGVPFTFTVNTTAPVSVTAINVDLPDFVYWLLPSGTQLPWQITSSGNVGTNFQPLNAGFRYGTISLVINDFSVVTFNPHGTGYAASGPS